MPIFEAMGVAMMAGAMASAASSGLENSVNNVEAACKARNDANNKYNDMTKKWANILNGEEANETQAEGFATDLEQQTRLTYAATQALKATYDHQKFVKVIQMCLFIFILILVLLLKYFKIPQKIWNLVMGNK